MANKGQTLARVVGAKALIGTAAVAAFMGLGYHAHTMFTQQQTTTAFQQAQQQQAGAWAVVFIALNAVSYLNVSPDSADSGRLNRFNMSDGGVLPPLESLTPGLAGSDILVQFQKNHASGDPPNKINGIGFVQTVYSLAGQNLPTAVTGSKDYWASFQQDAANWTTTSNDGSGIPEPGDIVTWQNDTSDIGIVVEVNSDSIIVAQADTVPNLTTPDPAASMITVNRLQLVKLTMKNNIVNSPNGHAIAGFVSNVSLVTDPYNAAGSSLVNSIIAWAQKKLGMPYLYGGNCQPGGDPKTYSNNQLCDCSSFVQYAYKYGANLDLPRIADDQSRSGQRITIDTSIPFAQLQPGDLIFPHAQYEKDSAGDYVWGHVGMYVGHVNGKQGDNWVIEAPHTGDVVKYDPMTTGYWGAQGSIIVRPTVLAQAVQKEAASTGGNCPQSANGTMTVAQIKSCIISAFGQAANQALVVAACESSYNPTDRSSIPVAKIEHAAGVFQIIESTWNGTPQGKQNPVTPGTPNVPTDPRYNASANIQAALWLYKHDGNSWREWATKDYSKETTNSECMTAIRTEGNPTLA